LNCFSFEQIMRLFRAPLGLLIVLVLAVCCSANPFKKFLDLFKKRDKKVTAENPPSSASNNIDKDVEISQQTNPEASIHQHFIVTPEGLKIEYMSKPESCPEEELASKGKQVYFTYIAAINEKGEEGSMAVDKGENDFMLGGGHTMPGLDLGLDGMCVGEQRRLTIPPALGMDGMTLVYEVRLTAVGAGRPPANMWAEIDLNADHVIDPAEMERWFKEMKQIGTVPAGAFTSQDKDGDGRISWAEFDGPKGTTDPSKPSDPTEPSVGSVGSVGAEGGEL
jgi:FKBP-type peptidyl-prolyl cis-trans isomerase